MLSTLLSNMWMLITPVVILLTTLLSIFGRELLGNWLGLTRRSANRLIGILIIAMWALILLVRVNSATGTFELSHYGNVLYKSWWVVVLMVVWVITMFRKKLR